MGDAMEVGSTCRPVTALPDAMPAAMKPSMMRPCISRAEPVTMSAAVWSVSYTKSTA